MILYRYRRHILYDTLLYIVSWWQGYPSSLSALCSTGISPRSSSRLASGRKRQKTRTLPFMSWLNGGFSMGFHGISWWFIGDFTNNWRYGWETSPFDNFTDWKNLAISEIAVENGHRNSWFTYEQCFFSWTFHSGLSTPECGGWFRGQTSLWSRLSTVKKVIIYTIW